jgi:hypothetical protein
MRVGEKTLTFFFFCLFVFKKIITVQDDDGATRAAVSLALSVDDLEAFRRILDGESRPAVWDAVLELWTALPPLEDRAVSRDAVLAALVTGAGPPLAVSILLRHPSMCESRSAGSFLSFSRAAAVAGEQARLVHRALEALDRHLWAQARAGPVPPQVAHLAAAENCRAESSSASPSLSTAAASGAAGAASAPGAGAKSSAGAGPLATLLAHPAVEQSETTGDPALSFRSTHPADVFYESAAVMWGCDIAGGDGPRCAWCDVGLGARVGTAPDVVAFPCGHAFHEVCLAPEGGCAACLEDRFTSILLDDRDPHIAALRQF